MESARNGENKEREIQEITSNNTKLKDFIPIYIPAVEKGLIIDQSQRKKRFLDFLKAQPSKDWFLKFGFVGRLSPFSYLGRNPAQRFGSPTDPNPQPSDSDATTATTTGRRRFRVPFVRKINWQFLIRYGKNWIKHPMNIALLVWLFFVAAGLVVLFLLMTGLLDDAIQKNSQRKRWTEITNQILNALFTIMCLYQHPKLFHHLIILCRWRSKDAVELRTVYCKSSARRPYERAHMAIVIVLLHITCFSQYVLCGLYWGWTSKTRPEWAENLCIGLGIGAPVIAFLYTVYSPLGKKLNSEPEPVELETDEESQKQQSGNETSLRVRVVVTEPEWVGGLFDCWDDLTVGYHSFFCTFCVFGWNMERLGFGNMYVHMVTFILLCIAPLLVFSVSALNISDDTTQYIVGITGIVLCFLGLFYGGFWRIQMRKKFKLPANPFCCGSPAVTDFMQWLFCWSCSLAQEVRTGNFYEIEEDSFCRRGVEEEQRPVLVPLPREGGAGPMIRSSFDSSSRSGSDSMETAKDSSPESLSLTVEEEEAKGGKDEMMTPPLPPLIQLEDNQLPKSC